MLLKSYLFSDTIIKNTKEVVLLEEENKEKSFDAAASEEKIEPEHKSGDDWNWDASVQTDVDDLTVEKLAAQKAADEYEKAEESSEEATEDCGTCIVCGKSLYGSSSELYCTDCCAKFLKTQYGVGHIILAFVMVIVAAFGYFVCASTCNISSKILSAQTSLNEGRYEDAVMECSEASDAVNTVNSGVKAVLGAINENFSTVNLFTDGSRSAKIILNAMAQTLTINYNDRNTFTQSVESDLTEAQLALPKNAEIKACYDFCKTMDRVSDIVAGKWQTFIYDENNSVRKKIDFDGAMKYFDSVDVKSDAEKSVIEYYRFMTAYYAEKSPAEVLGYYDNAYKLAGDFSYMFLPSYLGVAWEQENFDKVLELVDVAIKRNANDTSAYYYAIKTYIGKEDYAKADEFCEKMRKVNPEGLDYYSVKAEILRREGKFEDAVDICKKGLSVGSDVEIYRQQAIALMLLDRDKEALEAAKEAYNITLQNAYSNGNVSLEALNTAALISKLSGDETVYKEIVDLFKQEGMELEESVQKCVKGEITFEQIFMEGTGEV